MAKCEEGYLCQVCSGDVENLRDSALYLQFILGWIDPETLHTHRECHLTCAPTLAQFIDDARFDRTMLKASDMDRELFDPQFVQQRTELVSRGYRRLCELDAMRDRPPVIEYLLPELGDRWR